MFSLLTNSDLKGLFFFLPEGEITLVPSRISVNMTSHTAEGEAEGGILGGKP